MTEQDRQKWDKLRRQQNAAKAPYHVAIAEWKEKHPQDSVQASSVEVQHGQMLKKFICQKLATVLEEEQRPNRRKPAWGRASQYAQELVNASNLRVMERIELGNETELCKCEMTFRIGAYGLKTLRVLSEELDASGSGKKGLWFFHFEVKCPRALFS